MAEHPVAIRYENTLEDAIALQLYCLDTVPALRRDLNLRFLALVAFTFVGLFVVLAGGMRLARLELTPFRLLLAFGASLTGALWRVVDHPRLVKKHVRMQLRGLVTQEQYPGFLSEHLLEARGEGLFLRTAVSETRTAWSAIQRVVTTPEHVFLFTCATDAHIVPRDRLLDGDLTAFMEEVEQHVGLSTFYPA